MIDLYNAHISRVENIRNECLKQQKLVRPIKQEKQQKNRINWYKRSLRKKLA